MSWYLVCTFSMRWVMLILLSLAHWRALKCNKLVHMVVFVKTHPVVLACTGPSSDFCRRGWLRTRCLQWLPCTGSSYITSSAWASALTLKYVCACCVCMCLSIWCACGHVLCVIEPAPACICMCVLPTAHNVCCVSWCSNTFCTPCTTIIVEEVWSIEQDRWNRLFWPHRPLSAETWVSWNFSFMLNSPLLRTIMCFEVL